MYFADCPVVFASSPSPQPERAGVWQFWSNSVFAFLGLQKDGEKQVIHQATFSVQQMLALLGRDLINDVYIIITEFQYIVFDVYNHR